MKTKRRLRSHVNHLAPRNAFFHVRVFYDGGLDQTLDQALFNCASTKPKKGRLSDSSGCCMFPPYTRDHEWDFVKLDDAFQCFERLKAFLLGEHSHPMPKRRIELWDERPRLVNFEKARRIGPPNVKIPRCAPAARRKRKSRAAA
jgi:hypothetical protein